MELLRFTLPNGIRLIHRHLPSTVAHFGIFIQAGTRNETEKEHGIAHFIEHTIFKGTKKRNLFQVLNRLENVGADLNAYTSKEETCFYATFLHEYYERTMELFNDILFKSLFPEKEIEKEKQVVIEEIRTYLDTPSEQIFDDFEDMVFAGHPLGKNILGTAKSLKAIQRKDILNFILNNYRPEGIVLVSAGKIEWKRLLRLADKYFNIGFTEGKRIISSSFQGYMPVARSVKKRNWQVHCVLGSTAYAYPDERRVPLALLNNMLGGPVMNSRLSLALRERNGLTYQNESNYTSYSDAGIISIYFATDQSQFEKALGIIHRELETLRTKKLTPIQLHTVQKQLIGQLSIAQESNLGQMLAVGKSFLLQNQYDPFEQIIERIRATTAEELIGIANEIFDPVSLSMLTYRTS